MICGNSDQATAGSDTLLGGEGNDTLIGSGMLLGEGGNARDSLLGGSGDDTLNAQGGDDLLIGGAGNDKLLGGMGANDLSDKDANDLTPATGGAASRPERVTLRRDQPRRGPDPGHPAAQAGP